MRWCANLWHGGTIERHSLSQPFGLPAPSEREPGTVAGACTIQPGTRSTATLRAIFIAPTKLKSFYIPPLIGVHSLSLAFARQLPQRGSREWGCAIQRAARKPEGGGRFSSPLRSSESFTFHHSTGYSLRRKGGGRFSSPLRKLRMFYISPFIGVVAKSEKGHLGEDGPWGGYFSRITGQETFTALLM